MKTGPKPKTHCKNGHELTPENTYQTYKNGKLNGRACRECNRILQKSYRERNPEIMRKSRLTAQNRKRYGMQDISDRDKVLEAQGGGCAICERTDCVWGTGFQNVWHIDHKHGSEGTHRGVLCGTCNMLLGSLESNPAFMANFQVYLEKYK